MRAEAVDWYQYKNFMNEYAYWAWAQKPTPTERKTSRDMCKWANTSDPTSN